MPWHTISICNAPNIGSHVNWLFFINSMLGREFEFAIDSVTSYGINGAVVFVSGRVSCSTGSISADQCQNLSDRLFKLE